jgi:hypothetical protein
MYSALAVFAGCVVLRLETEVGEPTTEFLVLRGCDGKILERETKKVAQADYHPPLR